MMIDFRNANTPADPSTASAGDILIILYSPSLYIR